MIVQESEGSSITTTLREVEVNTPVDDARFQKPKIEGGPRNRHFQLDMPPKDSAIASGSQPTSQPAKIESPAGVPTPQPPPPLEPAYVVTTDFVTCSISELQQFVPELRKLKPSEYQANLPSLLDKIGQRTLDISRRVPNLISNEEVVYSEFGAKSTRQKFSYLILARRDQDWVTLQGISSRSEDRRTLETEDALKSGNPSPSPGPVG